MRYYWYTRKKTQLRFKCEHQKIQFIKAAVRGANKSRIWAAARVHRNFWVAHNHLMMSVCLSMCSHVYCQVYPYMHCCWIPVWRTFWIAWLMVLNHPESTLTIWKKNTSRNGTFNFDQFCMYEANSTEYRVITAMYPGPIIYDIHWYTKISHQPALSPSRSFKLQQTIPHIWS